MFTGINIFWARLRLGLARAAGRGLKWTLRRAGPRPKFSILARKTRHNARKSDNNHKISIWCHQIQLNATPIVKMFGVLIFMNDIWFAIGESSFTMLHYKLSAAMHSFEFQNSEDNRVWLYTLYSTKQCDFESCYINKYFRLFFNSFHARPPPLNKIIIQAPM